MKPLTPRAEQIDREARPGGIAASNRPATHKYVRARGHRAERHHVRAALRLGEYDKAEETLGSHYRGWAS